MKTVFTVLIVLLLVSCATKKTIKTPESTECIKEPTRIVPFKASAIPRPQFGIGASVRTVGGKFYIVDIVPGGPASLNSFQEGDEIIAISANANGYFEAVDGMQLQDLVYEIRGCKKTPLALRLKRAGNVFVLETFRGDAN